MKVYVPPIKSQGIKTKLVPWIKSVVPHDFDGIWVEPFMGTGVVAFNLAPKNALLCDTNPHLIGFYSKIANGSLMPSDVRRYLQESGAKLSEKGGDYYYEVRERFNTSHDPLDFLFLNRAGFNGMIRFNRNGDFNIPFCHKKNRFSQAYVTKIVNQVSHVKSLFDSKNFQFKCQSFQETVQSASYGDLVYCDPPYIGRHVDYFNGWNEQNELELFNSLKKSKANFVLSTWHHNDYRENEFIQTLWAEFHVLTCSHYYHVGASEKNRNPVVEALVTNFVVTPSENLTRPRPQLELWEQSSAYANA